MVGAYQSTHNPEPRSKYIYLIQAFNFGIYVEGRVISEPRNSTWVVEQNPSLMSSKMRERVPSPGCKVRLASVIERVAD